MMKGKFERKHTLQWYGTQTFDFTQQNEIKYFEWRLDNFGENCLYFTCSDTFVTENLKAAKSSDVPSNMT